MAFCVLTKDEMISDFDKDVMYFDMSGFEAGIYMVRVVADGNEVTRKVSVIR